MATVDIPEHKDDTAKEVAECVRAGFAIEHVTVGYVRENWSNCTCAKPETEQPELFAVTLENLRTGSIVTVLRTWTMSNGETCLHLSNGAYIPASALSGWWREVKEIET